MQTIDLHADQAVDRQVPHDPTILPHMHFPDDIKSWFPEAAPESPDGARMTGVLETKYLILYQELNFNGRGLDKSSSVQTIAVCFSSIVFPMRPCQRQSASFHIRMFITAMDCVT